MSLGIIIVAAGSGRRMGQDKLLLSLEKKSVLQHSLDAFQHLDIVDHIVCVTSQMRFASLNCNAKKVTHCEGGAERQESVLKGIEQMPNHIKFIGIHDGARPLISENQIHKVWQAAQQHQAASSAKRITDTVKRATTENFHKEAVSRENLWAMETPQIFNKMLLKQAYAHIKKHKLEVTDEVSALAHIEVASHFIANTEPNPKITFPEDLAFAHLLLKQQQ